MKSRVAFISGFYKGYTPGCVTVSAQNDGSNRASKSWARAHSEIALLESLLAISANSTPEEAAQTAIDNLRNILCTQGGNQCTFIELSINIGNSYYEPCCISPAYNNCENDNSGLECSRYIEFLNGNLTKFIKKVNIQWKKH